MKLEKLLVISLFVIIAVIFPVTIIAPAMRFALEE